MATPQYGIENRRRTDSRVQINYAGTRRLHVDANGAQVNGTFTPSGVIVAAVGTAAAPGYSFLADLNTGIYRATADQVELAAGGAPTISIGAAAITLTATGAAPAFIQTADGSGDSIIGSAMTITTGDASAASSSGAGDAGGALALVTGAGSAGNTTGVGGAGGAVSITSGAGGASAGAANGGASGAVTILSGIGGANGDDANPAGVSGLVTVGSGRGAANATGAGGTGGAGGNLVLQIGRGGEAVAGTAGADGLLRLLDDAGAGLGIEEVASGTPFTSPGNGIGNVFAVQTWGANDTGAANTAVLCIETA